MFQFFLVSATVMRVSYFTRFGSQLYDIHSCIDPFPNYRHQAVSLFMMITTCHVLQDFHHAATHDTNHIMLCVTLISSRTTAINTCPHNHLMVCAESDLSLFRGRFSSLSRRCCLRGTSCVTRRFSPPKALQPRLHLLERWHTCFLLRGRLLVIGPGSLPS